MSDIEIDDGPSVADVVLAQSAGWIAAATPLDMPTTTIANRTDFDRNAAM
jgi:hypothetical protein